MQLTETVVDQARQTVDVDQARQTVDVDQARQTVDAVTTTADAAAQRIAGRLDDLLPLVEQVLQQTTRRVLQGEAVPAPEKVVSLFEPHTAILRKGEPGKPVEFGRLIWLDEVDSAVDHVDLFTLADGFDTGAREVIDCAHGRNVIAERKGRAYQGSRRLIASHAGAAEIAGVEDGRWIRSKL